MTEAEAIKELKVKYLGDSDAIVDAKQLAIKALEKQIAKKPISTDWLRCPTCNVTLKVGLEKYCEHCGQKLDWSEV